LLAIDRYVFSSLRLLSTLQVKLDIKIKKYVFLSYSGLSGKIGKIGKN